MAMDFARISKLYEELKAEEANIKYVRQMRCDYHKTWYVTVCIEPPRYRELYDAIAQEQIFPCRCCGEKVSYLELKDKTENNYLCSACAPRPTWEYEGDDEFDFEDDEEFEV